LQKGFSELLMFSTGEKEFILDSLSRYRYIFSGFLGKKALFVPQTGVA